MTTRWGGASRRSLRDSTNRGTGDDHLFELEGANRLTIFLPPNAKMKGYRDLAAALEAAGCAVAYPSLSPDVRREMPGPRFKAINIEAKEHIAPEALRAAHRWAHKRDLLHTFFRPL